MVADDFNGVFVRAYRTVGTQAPELAGAGALGGGVGIFLHLQRQLGHIVFDADGELFLGAGRLHVAVNGNDLAGGGVLGTQAIAAGIHRYVAEFGILQRGAHIQIQRFAQGARLLGAVEHRNALHGFGQRGDQVFRREGAIQAHLDQADLVARGVHVVHRLLDGFAHGAHGDDDALGVAGTIVIEQLIVGADLRVDFVHVVFDDGRHRFVIAVGRLTRLEEDIGVLRRAALHRMLRVQRVFAEPLHGVPIDHIGQVVVVPHFNFLYLMGGAEAVEEMQERHPALQGGQVRYRAQIHNLLYTGRAEHGIAGLPAGIHVGMVAENRQRMRRECAGGHVDDVGQQLAGDLVHIGDHQQQALGRRIGRGQRTGLERPVHRARGAALRLHFRHLDRTAEQVFLPGGRPYVGHLCHNGRRGNGVDGGDVGERIGYMRGGVVAIHGFLLSCHEKAPPLRIIKIG